MNENVAIMLKAYSQLSPIEQQEFLQYLEKLKTNPGLFEDVLKGTRGGVTSIHLGPSPAGCPVCGK